MKNKETTTTIFMTIMSILMFVLLNILFWYDPPETPEIKQDIQEEIISNWELKIDDKVFNVKGKWDLADINYWFNYPNRDRCLWFYNNWDKVICGYTKIELTRLKDDEKTRVINYLDENQNPKQKKVY